MKPEDIIPRLKRSKTRNVFEEQKRASQLNKILNQIKPKTAECLLGIYLLKI